MIKKKQIKAMPSTLRQKKRYIIFKISSPIKESQLKNHLLNFLGVFGFALANPQLILFDEKTNKGILRTSLLKLNEVISALLMLKDEKNNLMQVQIISVSGTLKKAKNAFKHFIANI
jgi:RNase P/RNase MRP subunit POP5